MSEVIEVTIKRKRDAAAVQRALEDPETYALVVIIGSLLPFSKPVQRAMLELARVSVEEQG